MNLDFRALCAELIDALDGWHQAVLETGSGWVKPDEACLLDRARAALAAPDGPAVPEGREPASVVEEPSDEELLELMPEGFTAPASVAAAIQANVLSFARAVLARFGHQPKPPAAGEVAKLVEWLRQRWPHPHIPNSDYAMGVRAADLLEQRHPAPVPVSERLPEPEDCDAEGRVWWLGVDTWMLRNYVLIDGTAIPLGTHWLPATALPLPQGEVE